MSTLIRFIGILLLASIATGAHAETAEQMCKEKFNIPEEREIRFEVEKNHDPQLFLYRRCLRKERQERVGKRRALREAIRDINHGIQSSSKVQALQERLDNHLQRELRQADKTRSSYRGRTSQIDASQLKRSRASRRTIVRQKEGEDRINSLRRKLRTQTFKDPCEDVGAIRKRNNPCGTKRYY